MRDKNIDILRGFAILLVVIGHAVVYNTTAPEDMLIYKLIYSFHMPLFMFLSGYVLFGRENINTLSFIFKKFRSLIIPYISWSTVYYFVLWSNVPIRQYFYSIIFTPGREVWFLWVLFIMFLLFALSQKNIWVLISIAVMIKLSPYTLFGFDLIKWLFPFFIMGYLFAKYRDTLNIFKIVLLGLSLVSYTLLLPLWTKEKNLPSYILAVTAIIIVYFLVPRFINIRWIGTKTLVIYAAHFLFLGYGFGNGFIRFATTTLISLIGALFIGWLLNQTKVTRLIFLGKNKLK